MQLNKTPAQLKYKARQLLQGNFRNAIFLLAASNLIISCLTFVFDSRVPTSVISMVISYLINFVLTILSSVFMVGQCSFYLKLACKQKVSFQDLFEGFKVYPEKTVVSQIILQLLTSVPLIPGFLLAQEISAGIDPTFTTLPTYNESTMWMTILGFVVYLWLSMMFSQTHYLLLDFPELSALDLLKKSYILMKGHKRRLFLLQLSFLPLTFLSLFSLGLGFLFLLPYQYMTQTLFYLDLVSSNTTEGF